MNAFMNETDLNLKIGNSYVSFVGGILTKIDGDGKQSFAVDGKWVNWSSAHAFL